MRKQRTLNPSNKLAAVQSSIIRNEEILKLIAKSYSIRPSKVEFFRRGLNDTYVINAEGDRYFFRVSRVTWRTISELESEVQLLEFLHKKGIHVAPPCRTNKNTGTIRIHAPEGSRFGTLFKEAEGTPVFTTPTQKECINLGTYLATMHTALDEFPKRLHRPTIDHSLLLAGPTHTISSYAQKYPAILKKIQTTGKILSAYLKELPTSSPYFGLCHGDVNFSNLHFGDGTNPVLFDFDCSGYGWRMFDIAFLIASRRTAHKSNRAWLKEQDLILNSYSLIRQLTRGEVKSLPMFALAGFYWVFGQQSDPQIVRYFGVNRFTQKYFVEVENTIDFWCGLM